MEITIQLNKTLEHFFMIVKKGCFGLVSLVISVVERKPEWFLLSYHCKQADLPGLLFLYSPVLIFQFVIYQYL